MLPVATSKYFSTFFAAQIVWILLSIGLVLTSPCTGASSREYLLENSTKLARLRATPPKRLIIIGGSNAAHNFDSAELEKFTGRHVVNLGLHFGLGLDFMLKQIEPLIKTDDVILIVPEYEHFYGLLYGDQALVQYLFLEPSTIAVFNSPQQWLGLGSSLWALVRSSYFLTPERVWRNVNKLVDVAVSLVSGKVHSWHECQTMLRAQREAVTLKTYRKSFQQNGDLVIHLDGPVEQLERKNLELSLRGRQFHGPEAVSEIERFIATTKGRGIRVLLTFPAMPEATCSDNRELISAEVGFLKRNTTARVLATPEFFTYPDRCFLDGPYHLRPEYRAANTKRLEQVLAGSLQTDGKYVDLVQ